MVAFVESSISGSNKEQIDSLLLYLNELHPSYILKGLFLNNMRLIEVSHYL